MKLPARFKGGPMDGRRGTIQVFSHPYPGTRLAELRWYIRALRGAEDGRGQPIWQHIEADGSSYAIRWHRGRIRFEYIGVF